MVFISRLSVLKIIPQICVTTVADIYLPFIHRREKHLLHSQFHTRKMNDLSRVSKLVNGRETRQKLRVS